MVSEHTLHDLNSSKFIKTCIDPGCDLLGNVPCAVENNMYSIVGTGVF